MEEPQHGGRTMVDHVHETTVGSAANRHTPKQLKFRVEYCSGEDPEFPASELNTHSPQTKGWQTPPFCDFPQEIGIRFLEGVVHLSQLQILSHESKIATKIDVYVGDGEDYGQCTFKRLGYLSLDSNERSEYAARELKSVYVTAKGKFLKLSIHKCHLNRHNMYNQAGIIAINVLGFVLPPESLIPGHEVDDREGYSPYRAGGEKVSPTEDLAFDMNFDPVTAARIREVHQAKDTAVEQEEYELAKRLKQIEDQLKSQGVQLAELEAEKKRAVEEEDYDRAQAIKQEITRIRDTIEHQLAEVMPRVNQIRIPQPHQGPYGGASHLQQNPHFPSHQMQNIQVMPQQQQQEYYSRPSQGEIHHGRLGDIDVTVPEPEDVPINVSSVPPHEAEGGPANGLAPIQPGGQEPRRMDPQEIAEALEGVPGAEELPEADEIPVAMVAESAPLVQVFGEYVIRCLFSSHVRLRSAALSKIELELEDFDFTNLQKFSVLCAVIRMTVVDKLANVFILSVRLLGIAIEKASVEGKLRRLDVQTNVDFLPAIVEKLGDITPRIRDSAHRIMLQLARSDLVGVSFVSAHVLKPLRPGKTMLWRPLLARLKLVTELIKEFKLQNKNGLTLKAVMNLVTTNNGHLHPNSHVRDASKEITMEVYRLVGDAVLPYLKELRKKQMEEYQTGFIEIDRELGRPSSVGITGAPLSPPIHSPSKAGETSSYPSKSPEKRTHQTNDNDTREPEDRIFTEEEYTRSPLKEKKKGKKPHASKKQDDPQQEEENADGSEGDDNEFADDDEHEAFDEPFTCQFCGRHDPSFTDMNLDVHYWRECPMLCGCPRCEQIIEVSTLNDHLLNECAKKDNHRMCPRCGEAIAARYFELHVKRNNCLPCKPLDEANRCPLCHKDIPPGETGWKKHLLIGAGCPKNKRTEHLQAQQSSA